jgi:hypothetical protein
MRDQALRQREAVAHAFVGQQLAGVVAHHLVHLDQDAALRIRLERQRLHARIDLSPLFGPVGADCLRPAHEAALERARPGHVGRHQSQRRGNVAAIEGRVDGPEQIGGGVAEGGHGRWAMASEGPDVLKPACRPHAAAPRTAGRA